MVQGEAINHSRCHANAERRLQKEIIQGRHESKEGQQIVGDGSSIWSDLTQDRRR